MDSIEFFFFFPIWPEVKKRQVSVTIGSRGTNNKLKKIYLYFSLDLELENENYHFPSDNNINSNIEL